jgi:hypothetical protein
MTVEVVGGPHGGVRGVGKDGTVEWGVGFHDVDQIFCLPVPEKAKKQHNFVVLPSKSSEETILWTYVEPTGKELREGEHPGPGAAAKAIDLALKAVGKRVIFPDAKEFKSAVPESHRKNEATYHVKAFRGSKEGAQEDFSMPVRHLI